MLVFALAQGLFWIGVASTFVMGLGTAITVARVATLAVAARGFAGRLAKAQAGRRHAVLRGVETAAAMLIIVFGVALLAGYMVSERMMGINLSVRPQPSGTPRRGLFDTAAAPSTIAKKANPTRDAKTNMTIQLTQRNPRLKIQSAGLILILISGVCVIPQGAAAHIIQGAQGGLGSGFEHPLTGADHFLAMFAVGLWGAQMGGRHGRHRLMLTVRQHASKARPGESPMSAMLAC